MLSGPNEWLTLQAMRLESTLNLRRIAFIIFVSIVAQGCSGAKIAPSKTAELVIPPDLAKAFEVKEMPPEKAIPLSESPKLTAKEKKNLEKKKQAQVKKRRGKSKKSDSKEEVVGPSNAIFVIPNRRPQVDPLWVGEKIWMDVTWLNTKAGEFLLEVQPFKELDGRRVYDLKGSARTSDLFSLVYKAEDWVQSFVDYEGWFPYKFVLHGDETKHVRNHLELYDHGAKKQYVHVHDLRVQKNEVHEVKGYKDLTPLSQDALSGLYYARNYKLEPGDVVKFPMTTGGNQWETNLIVVGREEVQTKMGYLKAIKAKVETRFAGVLKTQGDAFIWFSDDERKFPLRFEAKVRIGWVAGIAKKIEPGTPPQVNIDQADEKGKKTTQNVAPTEFKPTEFKNVKGRLVLTSSAAPLENPTEKPIKQRTWFRELLKMHDALSRRLKPSNKVSIEIERTSTASTQGLQAVPSR